MLNPKKIFKEKKSVKEELAKALLNKTPVNANILAKLVGISVHRVKKYCKNHNIDLNNYSLEALNQKPIPKPKITKTKKKVVMEVQSNKIVLDSPRAIKIKLD